MIEAEEDFRGIPQGPDLLDTTLRDGEQSPGLYFTDEEKAELACRLDALGVAVIEAGIPGMGSAEQGALRRLARLPLRAEILAWNRLDRSDVRASLEAGVRHVHVSVPTSRQQLERKLGKNLDWVKTRMEEVIGFARAEGLSVSLGAEDASRSDETDVAAVFHHAEDLGVRRVRYADTLGVMTPERAAGVMRRLSGALSIPIDFHGHNDFGLAGANALAAWRGGASVVSCSLLGLGERAGNTTLEEFVGAAHFLYGAYAGYDFVALRGACESAAGMCGRPFSPQKPLFGRDVFRHESGIHVDGILKDPGNYEPFPPERVGGRRDLVVGKHSGKAALKFLASALGESLSDLGAAEFLNALRGRMAAEKGVDAQGMFSNFLHIH
jgi:homocitrate synthase NifV